MRRALRRTLEKRSIAVHENAEVVRVEPHALCCADGRRIAFDELLWVTQAGAAPWLAETGLALDKRGFLALEATLRSMTDPRIFGAGDVATVLPHKRPKAGVFAVRQGPPLADNLRRAAASKGLCPFVPQRHFLSIIGTGEDNAVAARGGLAVEGRWVWRWKEWIDRRWIRRYQDLPSMPARAASRSPGEAMRCGGCGAKIASPILARVLARLDPASGSDVELGIGDDAAVLRLPPDRLMLQTADFFRSFVGDPYLFGRIAANHALGDIYAMGGAPMSGLAIAAVPHNAEPIVEDELFQMLSGAKETLDAAGARLVGGHSAEGGELALGFAVTGTAPSGRILRKGGLRAGDRLVLTKPLGTGVLLAAEMRGAAKARWVEAALEAMQQNAADAASCLLAHGATGCTDVTGFGLGGHLLEMLRASGIGAVLLPGAVPVLAGVREMVRAGIASTLAPANEAATRPWIAAEADLVDPLLFDPQTAGGLLAGIPEARAEACVTALRRLGYAHATVIGAVMAIEAGERPLHVVARLPAREAATVAGE
jgi:selenide,water dikinase